MGLTTLKGDNFHQSRMSFAKEFGIGPRGAELDEGVAARAAVRRVDVEEEGDFLGAKSSAM